MNEDFNSNRPPDGEPDLLLEALRQRLGVGFGQEPSPGLWAGIREQLPTPAPRPWWPRARRLLPLLAGLLLVSLVLVRQATRTPLASRPPGRGPANRQLPATPVAPLAAAPSRRPAGAAIARVAPASRPALTGAPRRAASASSPGIGLASGAAAPVPGAAATPPAQGNHLRSNHHLYPVAANAAILTQTHNLSPAETRRASWPLVSAHSSRRRGGTGQSTTSTGELAALNSPSNVRVSPLPPDRTPAIFAGRTTRSLASASNPGRRLGTYRRRATLAQPMATAAGGRHQLAGLATGYAAASRKRREHLARRGAGSPTYSDKSLLASSLPTHELGADTLALRKTGLLLPVRPLPAPLAARPDSFAPHLAPVRRWAVLVLAGPTLSYRALPVSNLSYSYGSSPATASPVSNGSTRASTSYTDLERPAAGLGAQVQVRRALSGRWALAGGLGYQEYATRISTSGSTLSYTTSPNSPYAFDSAKAAGNLRDTYRLLTMPVQLSYALGPPHGRVALGLLGGLEPGWYLGGQSAEASNCHCQQQSFTSASASPYTAFTLGINLGLDVRLRLGVPASRWQLVLQPTGRYVATSFVRSTSLYVRRQPYSLGVLAGVAWAFY